jgi:hypothetical protein
MRREEAMTTPISVSKFEIVDPRFFFIPFRSMTVENEPGTGRTYFIKDDRVVAVALPTGSIGASQSHSQTTCTE